MHPHALFPLLLSLIPTVASWPVDNDCYIPPGASCEDFMIPVTTTSNNYPWVGPKWNDDFGFIDFASVASSRTDAGFPLPLGAPISQTAKYTIGATFCTPTHTGKNSGKVLLASHGLGFDRSYWNPGYKPDQYNFVQYAINEGYSVFFYDRLGVGVSDKISGWFNQLNIQVSVLSQLIASLRANQNTLLPTAPESITLIGHSFGSYMTNALLAIEPNAADAAIMTGYGLVGADARIVLEGFGPRVANIQSDNFSAFDAGYITTRDVISNINNFFKAPAYEHDVAIFSEATKQPFAISELVSLTSSLLKLNAKDYQGPALVISGEFDYILCGGYCPGELSASFDPLFMGSKGFETYVQPAVGHGLNFHKNATGAFRVIFEYLEKNGI